MIHHKSHSTFICYTTHFTFLSSLTNIKNTIFPHFILLFTPPFTPLPHFPYEWDSKNHRTLLILLYHPQNRTGGFRPVRLHRLGLVEYEKAWNWQKTVQKKRFRNNLCDELILVEHPPVYISFNLVYIVDIHLEEVVMRVIFSLISKIPPESFSKLKEEVR